MILGLSGGKGHGKDTLANMLIAAVPSFQPLSFAKRLKEICVRVYGLTDAQVNDEMGKEMLLADPIDLDARLDALQSETGLSIGAKNLIARTPRQVLQYVGTDYVRSARPSYWLDIVQAQFLSSPGQPRDFVITDTRFANEAELVRLHGGKTLRILRLAKAVAAEGKAEHSSEALDFRSDYTLAVMENDFSLHRIICSMAREGMLLEGLTAFNWDSVSFAAPVCRVYYRDIWPAMAQVASEALERQAVAA